MTNKDPIFALIVDGGTLGINLKSQKVKRTMLKTKAKTESTREKQIDHLTESQRPNPEGLGLRVEETSSPC